MSNLLSRREPYRKITPVLRGLDWLMLFSHQPIEPESFDKLKRAHSNAVGHGEKQEIVWSNGIKGHVLATKPKKKKGFFTLRMRDFDIQVRGYDPKWPTFATAFIKLKCKPLWQKGLPSVYEDVVETWGLLTGQTPDLKISEVHACVDVQGMSPSDMNPGYFISQSNTHKVFNNDGGIPGFTFGTGKNIRVTIYDKPQLIYKKKRKGKPWFFDLWRQCPYYDKSDQRVMRIEFKLCRKDLRGFKKRLGGYWESPAINTIVEFLSNLPEVWEHLTTQWISLRIPHPTNPRTRWKLDPRWKHIQRAFDPLVSGAEIPTNILLTKENISAWLLENRGLI